MRLTKILFGATVFDMKLIVGLGNPGEKYEKTRHNLGFMVVEHFLHEFENVQNTLWEDNKKFKSDIAEFDWQSKDRGGSQRIILAKPKTYMNNSGMAVGLIATFYKIGPSDIWIVYDELDLPLGTVKIRIGGAAAGHHGVESVMASLGTDKFWRFRLGIGQQKELRKMSDRGESASGRKNTEDYVLGKFSSHQKGKTKELIKHATHALQTALEDGLDVARNRFNTK